MTITVNISDAIATVTLARPDKLNALSDEMKEQLTETFGELNLNDDVRAVILTGEGRGFCAGGDVGTMKEQTPLSSQRRITKAQGVVRALVNLDKPVIAAVRGPIAGIGWSLAMACDMVLASETAKFHQSFKRIGLVPDGAAIFFLARTLGPVLAKELIFSARPMPAGEALTHRLVNRVLPDDTLDAEARTLALELASGPTFAFGLTKQMFRNLDQPRLEAFLEVEAWAQGLAMLSRDHQEGAAAFRDKRSPSFLGR